jgi:hypothetical protein
MGWALAATTGNPWIVPSVTLLSVTSWSAWFIHYGLRVARY